MSIIRLVSIRQLDFSDVTWQFSRVAYWGAVEVNLAIIAACLTTLKPLLVRTFLNLLGSSLNAYGPSSNMMRRGGTPFRSQRGGRSRLTSAPSQLTRQRLYQVELWCTHRRPVRSRGAFRTRIRYCDAYDGLRKAGALTWVSALARCLKSLETGRFVLFSHSNMYSNAYLGD